MDTSLGLITRPSVSDAGSLQFSRIVLNEEYRKKWNVYMDDFVVLTVNEKMLRPVLYRVGGMGMPKLGTDRYFMLIKHVEAQYSKEIMKGSASKNPNHLESKWCIMDAEGNEKVEFKPFASPYLVADSCLYSIDNKYYNIETGESYGKAYISVSSKDFVFLDTKYADDTAKRGIMKISKKDGTWELFP